MSIYLDKLTHTQVVINCLYSATQFCTSKDKLAHILGPPSTDDVMSYDSLTTQLFVSINPNKYQPKKFWSILICKP